MIHVLWMFSVHIRSFLRRRMPTNLVLDLIRSRRGLKWGIPAMLLSAPYLLAASICVDLIAEGWPGWLNLLVLVLVWNAMKFLAIGPVSVFLLARARIREAAEPRHTRRDHATATVDRP